MKKLWMMFPALLLIAGMVLVGCGNDTTSEPGNQGGPITWTLSQKGGEVDGSGIGKADTTDIVINFSAEVSTLGSTNVQIITTNRAAKKFGTVPVKGAGNTWEVPIDVLGAGDIEVRIQNLSGVETATKTVKIYKDGAADPIGWLPSVDGAAGTATTTKINFHFDKAVTGLEPSHITLTNVTGAATRGAVTGSGQDWSVSISNVSAGTIKVKIAYGDIDTAEKTVTVHKSNVAGADYDISELAIDSSEEEEPELGGGKITDDDFDAIMDANYGSFLRITIDTSGCTNANAEAGWGIGAVGNFKDDAGEEFEGSRNLSIVWPSSGDTVDLPLAEVWRYIDDADDFLYVNSWDGVKITKVELHAKKVADTPPTLDQGVVALIGLPNGGKLGYVDYLLILNSPDDYFLRLHSSTAMGGSIGSSWANGAGQTETVAVNGTIFNITVEKLKELGIGDAKEIIINIWSGALTKIELREPSQVVPIDVLKDGTLVAGAAVDGGTFANDEITVVHDGTQYFFKISFATPIDITGLEELEIEWNGIFTGDATWSLNNWGAQTKILFGDDGVSHQTTVESNPGTVNFAGDEVGWNDSWDEVDKTQCVGIEILSNWAGKTDGSTWPNLEAAEYEDLIITRITFK